MSGYVFVVSEDWGYDGQSIESIWIDLDAAVAHAETISVENGPEGVVVHKIGLSPDHCHPPDGKLYVEPDLMYERKRKGRME